MPPARTNEDRQPARLTRECDGMSRSTPPAIMNPNQNADQRAGIEIDSDTSEDAHREIGDAEQDRRMRSSSRASLPPSPERERSASSAR
jgi:hypothetical protein